MRNFIYILLIFIISCNSEPKVNNNAPQLINDTIKENNKNVPDSLKDPENYYYLTNLPTTEAAKLILNGYVEVGDYKIMYNCLDSLNSKQKATRDYFFKVLIKMFENQEVVLSQNMGPYLIKYIDNNQEEFLNRIVNMKKENLYSFADAVGFTFSDKDDKGESWLKKLSTLLDSANAKQKEKLKYFINQTRTSAHAIMAE